MLQPNWFLTHIPAPGSDRYYRGLQSDTLEETGYEPLSPPAKLSARAAADARELSKLERAAR